MSLFNPNCPYRYRKEIIYKKNLVRILEFWQEHHPDFYALLSNLPLSSFRIVADDDYRETLEEWTIPRFFENLDLFHPRLTLFTICLQTYLYRSEWDDCDPKWRTRDEYFCGAEKIMICEPRLLRDLPDLYENILACQLRESMMEGQSFDIEAVCRSLKAEDAARFREMAGNCKERLLDEFRELFRNLQPFL